MVDEAYGTPLAGKNAEEPLSFILILCLHTEYAQCTLINKK
jgi:hypothetical protein